MKCFYKGFKVIVIIMVMNICVSCVFFDKKIYGDSSNSINDHVYVDLGLPSGTLWATCNVGAKGDPKNLGFTFLWGETQTVVGKEYSKKGDQLAPKDDVATVVWGSPWRMPTAKEIDELQKLCYWDVCTTLLGDGIIGFTVQGPNRNRIFLPSIDYSQGGYWSNTLIDSKNAKGIYFYGEPAFVSGPDPEILSYHETRSIDRLSSLFVRPVCSACKKTNK